MGGISIDVDALRHYGAIHGLPPVLPERDPIYSLGLTRFFELLDETGLPGTVFFIAEDLPRVDQSALRAGLRSTGSELASHSYGHDYRLSQRPREEIEEDLRSAHHLLSEVAPSGRVFGFRAPGYNTSPAMLEVLVELGYLYDSSLLPAPAYFAARAAAIGAYRAVGRRSASMVGDLRSFWGPTGPYRMCPSEPWKPLESGPLVELPMAVEPSTRLPIIGTSWVVFPERVRHRLLRRALTRLDCFVFEMHAIDLLDHSDPGIPPELGSAQPDLRRPARDKIELFRQLFRTLAGESEVRTLASIAGAFGPPSS